MIELRVWKIDLSAIISGLLVLFLVTTFLTMFENSLLMSMFLKMRLAEGPGGFVEGLSDVEVVFIYLLKLFFIFLAYGSASVVAALSARGDFVLHALVMGIAGALTLSIFLLSLTGVENAGYILETYYLVEKLWAILVCVAVGSLVKLIRRRTIREHNA